MLKIKKILLGVGFSLVGACATVQEPEVTTAPATTVAPATPTPRPACTEQCQEGQALLIGCYGDHSKKCKDAKAAFNKKWGTNLSVD